MPALRTTVPETPDELVRRLTPRDDILVAEVEVSAGRFHCIGGAFSTWTRTVEHDGNEIVETVTYRTAVPHWGRLMDQVLRRGARTRLAPGSNPWWAPARRLDAADSTIMGLCATLSMMTGFLGALGGLTMTYIAKDFGENVAAQSVALAVIRAGAILTFMALALADRAGRRPILRAVLIGSATAALLTAASPNLAAVTATQVVCRGLVAAAAFLLPVVCAEELPAHSRAYAIGIMAMSGGLGAGVVLWFLPIVDVASWAWRLIYLLAVPTIAVTLRTIRRLPETRRFIRDDHVPNERSVQHVRRSRLVVLAVGLFLLSMFSAPSQQLQNEYLRSARGYSATGVTLFLVLTNIWGGVGIVLGSRWADRRSRRATMALGLVGLAVGNSLMFTLSGAPMWMASIVGSMVGAAVVPSLGALQPELFPTLRRGTANGFLNGLGVIGSITGLLVAGNFVVDDRYGPTMMVLAVGPLIVALMMGLLPETAGRELEDLNPDDVAA